MSPLFQPAYRPARPDSSALEGDGEERLAISVGAEHDPVPKRPTVAVLGREVLGPDRSTALGRLRAASATSCRTQRPSTRR